MIFSSNKIGLVEFGYGLNMG